MGRRIEVAAYDPVWPVQYDAEAGRLKSALGNCCIAIHHIGSTAVPGLKAKPTIDILGIVTAFEELERLDSQLMDLGYEPRGENGIPGRRYYVKREGDHHLFHFHTYEPGHPNIANHLIFRDYLREHPDEANAYQELKVELVARFRDDPARYTLGKAEFIQGILDHAGSWREENSLD